MRSILSRVLAVALYTVTVLWAVRFTNRTPHQTKSPESIKAKSCRIDYVCVSWRWQDLSKGCMSNCNKICQAVACPVWVKFVMRTSIFSSESRTADAIFRPAHTIYQAKQLGQKICHLRLHTNGAPKESISLKLQFWRTREKAFPASTVSQKSRQNPTAHSRQTMQVKTCVSAGHTWCKNKPEGSDRLEIKFPKNRKGKTQPNRVATQEIYATFETIVR